VFPSENDLDGTPNWCSYENHNVFLCDLGDPYGLREQSTAAASIGSQMMGFSIGAPTINGVDYTKAQTPGSPCIGVHVLTRVQDYEDCYECDPEIPEGGIHCCCPWPDTMTLVPIMEL
jgi:hypothetical protein